MRDLDEIRRLVRKEWLEPEHLLKFLDVVAALPVEERKYLTVPLIKKLASCASLRESTEIAEYLAADRIGLLISHFELVVGEHETIALSDVDVHDALETGKLINPQTGEAIEDWSSNVLVFYAVLDDPSGDRKVDPE